MELQEFVASTLESIIAGIQTANKNLNGKGSFYIDFGKNGEVLFDIAITASEESKKAGGAGLKVYALNIGGEKGSTIAQENVSRIKFKINPNQRIS